MLFPAAPSGPLSEEARSVLRRLAAGASYSAAARRLAFDRGLAPSSADPRVPARWLDRFGAEFVSDRVLLGRPFAASSGAVVRLPGASLAVGRSGAAWWVQVLESAAPLPLLEADEAATALLALLVRVASSRPGGLGRLPRAQHLAGVLLWGLLVRADAAGDQ